MLTTQQRIELARIGMEKQAGVGLLPRVVAGATNAANKATKVMTRGGQYPVIKPGTLSFDDVYKLKKPTAVASNTAAPSATAAAASGPGWFSRLFGGSSKSPAMPTAPTTQPGWFKRKLTGPTAMMSTIPTLGFISDYADANRRGDAMMQQGTDAATNVFADYANQYAQMPWWKRLGAAAQNPDNMMQEFFGRTYSGIQDGTINIGTGKRTDIMRLLEEAYGKYGRLRQLQ